ncbi:MAG: ABC transporter permease [Methylibium sp. NZG]|nr:MAG: ABC transporter permease [Methylibium sp. NZG]
MPVAGGALDRARRRRLLIGLALASGVLLLAGLAAGSEGWSLDALRWSAGPEAQLIVGQVRAPRTLGAWLVGALLGLAGALAQGLFRNPLADPFLLGSAAGASLAVVVVLAAGGAGIGQGSLQGGAQAVMQFGLVGAAFAGALAGVFLTLALARGAEHTTRLLLAGVVVGVVLSALSDVLTTAAPDALRGKQAFMLGSTSFLGWGSVVLLAAGLMLTLPPAWRLARALDALTLGEDSARSLGLALSRWRTLLVALLALATGLAVSQAGLVAFVGLVAPHLVRRFAPAPNGFTLVASAAAGGTLLLAADVLARSVVAPQELPVGVLTALLGGGYLLWLLRK